MHKFGRAIVKSRVVILILAVLLLIPSVIGYVNTRVNFDVLTYLPKDIETMKGQDIMEEQFGTGAFSFLIVEGMKTPDIVELKKQVEDVDHVSKVIWYDSIMDPSVPMNMLPDDLYNTFNKDDATMMAVIFDKTTSEASTLDAVKEIRSILKKDCFLSGVSPVIEDTKELTDHETPIYVAIAVVLSLIVLALTMDSYLVPFVFLLSIGMAIVYNMGSNIMLGEVSYITKAVAAVLQLGVTLDYSIFLWHSYSEEKALKDNKLDAMAEAISKTFISVIGSSITTVAGFAALCFMTFTLGRDIGLVMAKGVLIGVISCVTILPSLILVLDKPLERTKHKPLMPNLSRISGFVTKHYKAFVAAFLILLIPALYGYTHYDVYYKLDSSLPKDLESMVANSKLEETFNMASTHMVLVDSSLSSKDVRSMTNEIKDTDGVKFCLGLDSLVGPAIPDSAVPDSIRSELENENYKVLLVGSEYKVATSQVNNQCTELQKIIKSYDKKGMLVGEAPCTKDLITITDKDLKIVNTVSIGIIFVIIALVFGSISLPFILVAVIEFAIFVNMGIPFYTGTKLPFVASIVIGTIQLGSTVDYAILMTTRYRLERNTGIAKREAVRKAHEASVQSVFVSAVGFFAATFGVAVYSDIDIISSLCLLMARGALISMATVTLVLPAMYMIFDRIIIMTTGHFDRKKIFAADRERKTNDRKGAAIHEEA